MSSPALFPKDFVWGAATSSYQIEGDAEGRGPTVWDIFCATDSLVCSGHDGRVACDHRNRYREDVALMSSMKLQAYRFSISWPRVLREGVGAVNSAGVDFYSRLVDVLLEQGITPYCTLFHWDFPHALYCRGGWLNRDSAAWFGEYAQVIVEALGDRVQDWITFNEPGEFVGNGHMLGHHAPGDRLNFINISRVIHHVLLAHGEAVQCIRANNSAARVCIAVNDIPAIPHREDAEHIEEAKRLQWAYVGERAVWNPSLWLDPILFGNYSEGALNHFRDAFPIEEGDLEKIKGELDFIGLNLYHGTFISTASAQMTHDRPMGLGVPHTAMDWIITPRAIYWGTKFLFERYKRPIFITENGLASMDWIAGDGIVHDQVRIDFLRRYLLELNRAYRDGVDVRGYFCWSLLDNFEWAQGYKRRFGLIFVDYDTQQRHLKSSAHWYKSVIETNGKALGEVTTPTDF